MTSALFKSFFWSRNSHSNKTITQTFHNITYNTIILVRHAIQFLDWNFLYISKVLTFLDFILSSLKLGQNLIWKDLNLLDKEKISVQKLYNTANQINSVINSYYYISNKNFMFFIWMFSLISKEDRIRKDNLHES